VLCPPSAAHPPVPAPDRPTATVSPLRTPSSPSRLPAAAIRPHPAVSPQHGHQPPTPGARPLIPLTSAAAAITPPNVSAAHLNGEVVSGPLAGPVTPGPTSKAEERKNEKVRAAASLGILVSQYFHASSFPRTGSGAVLALPTHRWDTRLSH